MFDCDCDCDCSGGHTDSTNGHYHYHTPSTYDSYPYIVNCLRGCVTGRTCNTAGRTQSNYDTFKSSVIAASWNLPSTSYVCSTTTGNAATTNTTGTTGTNGGTGGGDTGNTGGGTGGMSGPPPPSGSGGSGGSGGPPPPMNCTGGSYYNGASCACKCCYYSRSFLLHACVTICYTHDLQLLLMLLILLVLSLLLC